MEANTVEPLRPPRSDSAWRRFAIISAAAAAAAGLVVLSFLLVVDPFDTGRLTPLSARGVHDQFPTTAHASRARDPSFEAAIIGNSHAALLAPASLGERTGMPFVSLVVPGARPREQISLLDHFLRVRGRPPKAIVIGVDFWWCEADPDLPTAGLFPFWLYGESEWDYVSGLFRMASLEAAAGRIAFLAGWREGAARDGFWNYVPNMTALGRHLPHERQAHLAAQIPEPAHASARFPSIERLARTIATIPDESTVVVLRTPMFAPARAPDTSPAGLTAARCADALKTLAQSRPNVILLDWASPRHETRDPESFYDPTHMTRPLAERIEADIAAALANRPGP